MPTKPPKTNTTLMLPEELAAALDDLLPWAKHQKYVGRNDGRNDLIRHLLSRGVDELRAEMTAHQKPRRK